MKRFVFAFCTIMLLIGHGQIVLSGEYIKWVDFSVTYTAMQKALDVDVKSHKPDSSKQYNWIDILARLAVKYGGDFKKYKEKDVSLITKQIDEGIPDSKTYRYFLEAYTAVLGQFVGPYRIQTKDEATGELNWQDRYGLKVFSPIAKGYAYNDFDDFGVGRSYGYKRKHLGHDLMALVGTPVIAVESGVIEELGWNRYGGWRIGIRSFDSKRYYYYAHLRKNYPYAKHLQKGMNVKAGDVIGYVGRTGYSNTENTNNITESHLHFGLQLIFDESQKEGVNQIWISLYEITKLLAKNKVAVEKIDGTKEYKRVFDFEDDATKFETGD